MTPEEKQKILDLFASFIRGDLTRFQCADVIDAIPEESESGIKVLLNKNVPPNEIWVNNGTEITRFIGLEQKE